MEPSIDEQVGGWLTALPGCNPIQPGPYDATVRTGCRAPTQIGLPQHYYTDVIGELGWEWIGCAVDNAGGVRILSGSSPAGFDMTVEKYISNCKAAGYTIAGLENSRECYCGNSIDPAKKPSVTPMGNCLYPCSGSHSQNCGVMALSDFTSNARATVRICNTPWFLTKGLHMWVFLGEGYKLMLFDCFSQRIELLDLYSSDRVVYFLFRGWACPLAPGNNQNRGRIPPWCSVYISRIRLSQSLHVPCFLNQR